LKLECDSSQTSSLGNVYQQDLVRFEGRRENQTFRSTGDRRRKINPYAAAYKAGKKVNDEQINVELRELTFSENRALVACGNVKIGVRFGHGCCLLVICVFHERYGYLNN